MEYDHNRRTFDCEPILTDSQVLEFCREGYLLLKGVVPDEINRRTCEYLEGRIAADPSFIPEGMTEADVERIRRSHEPSTICLESWFIEHVLLNAELAGVMRSLLGKNVGLPVIVSDHAVECPQPHQSWHQDADHIFGPELEFVEVFYFPQDTPAELGPTELMPGTHIGPCARDDDDEGVLMDGPAGTLGLHHQSILHRRGKSTSNGMRHMLKYNYWRTAPPQQDWIAAADFDLSTAYYGGHDMARYVAHMYYWLRGKGDEFRVIGDQAWPWRTENQIGPSYGLHQIQQRDAELEQRVEERTKELSDSNKMLTDSLSEKVVLLKEIHHRVKNNLQIIASLLSLQTRHITDKPTLEMLEHSRNRIRAMASIHEKLYQSDDLAKVDFAQYLKGLADYLFQSYKISQQDIRFQSMVENVALDLDHAIPCGLMINELISNSLKYAYPAGRKGEIRVHLAQSQTGYVLQVADDGVGFPADIDFRSSESLGLQLINTLVGQLHGSIEMENHQGTRFTIEFPGDVAQHEAPTGDAES